MRCNLCDGSKFRRIAGGFVVACTCMLTIVGASPRIENIDQPLPRPVVAVRDLAGPSHEHAPDGEGPMQLGILRDRGVTTSSVSNGWAFVTGEDGETFAVQSPIDLRPTEGDAISVVVIRNPPPTSIG